MSDWNVGDRVRVSKDVFGGYENSRGKATEPEYDVLVGMTGTITEEKSFLGIFPVYEVRLDETAALQSGPADDIVLSDTEMEAVDAPVVN